MRDLDWVADHSSCCGERPRNIKLLIFQVIVIIIFHSIAIGALIWAGING